MPKRIIMLNSSALRKASCKRRLCYVLEGYSEKLIPNDIVFGTCFHDFVAEYRVNGQELNSATKKGWAARDRHPNMYTKYGKDFLDDFNYFRMLCSMWAMENSDWETVWIGKEALVELPWAVPYYSGEHVEVILCGTVDDICIHKTNEGTIALRDYKTTSAFKVEEYFNKYRLSVQLMYYYIGLTEVCKLRPESQLAQMWLNAPRRGAFIEGVFIHKDATKIKYQTSDLFTFDDDRVTEFHLQLFALCQQLDKPPGHEFPREGMLNAACESDGYGRACAFFEACASNTREKHDMFLRSAFVKEKYDPLSI
jgi:hypothetical protein